MHILVGTPCYGGAVTVTYFRSFLKLREVLGQNGVQVDILMTEHESLITRARNHIANEFLGNARYSHLMFIDADIGFAPEPVLRYLLADKDVVCGIYPAKHMNIERLRAVPAAVPAAEAHAASLNYTAGLRAGERPDKHGLIRIDYGATGFMLIRRNVLETMAGAYPELRYRTAFTAVDGRADRSDKFAFFDTAIVPETGEYLPEDYAFCRRWSRIGGEIHGDLMSQLRHVGTHVYAGDFPKFLAHNGMLKTQD